MSQRKEWQGKPVKHHSTTQKGLWFWAEPVTIRACETCFCIVSQVDGYPGTEAFDDWFADYSAADEIAQKLAKGEL